MVQSTQCAVGWAMDALKLGMEPFLEPSVQPQEIAPILLKVTWVSSERLNSRRPRGQRYEVEDARQFTFL
jgi:hypothetical protein